jgi:hypothetical protein
MQMYNKSENDFFHDTTSFLSPVRLTFIYCNTLHCIEYNKTWKSMFGSCIGSSVYSRVMCSSTDIGLNYVELRCCSTDYNLPQFRAGGRV